MPIIKNIKDKIESVNKPEKVEKIIETAVRDIKREKAAAEKSKEAISERKQEGGELSHLEEKPGGLDIAAHTGVMAARKKIKDREKNIEKILEEDLNEIYATLTPEKQKEFLVAGEQTARQINIILGRAKFKIKEIISLIKKWLSIIPSVNKFFLEQEAKIKADKIIKSLSDKSLS